MVVKWYTFDHFRFLYSSGNLACGFSQWSILYILRFRFMNRATLQSIDEVLAYC